ncbi:MAG: hypothetical protein H0X66_18955 [Verrucomicrobia bacterium]|nr:hypothetical protein [Verrucomicrobiota bacterium]
MKKSILLASLALAASLQLGSAADITGKVTLKGTPPPEKPLDVIKNDPGCSKLIVEVPKTRFYAVNDKSELADVVISLKGVSGKSTGAEAKPILLDQIKCEYIPYVTAVQTRQTILVRNSDPVFHNVHPTPTVPGNKESNKAQMPKAKDLEFTFDNPEMFLRYKCDVHPWMFSYVSVFDHPYFDVSGQDGTFTIKNVPPGKYTLEANHRKGGIVTREIEVKDANVTADFIVEAK